MLICDAFNGLGHVLADFVSYSPLLYAFDVDKIHSLRVFINGVRLGLSYQ